jgi:predicted transposase YdaD
LFELLSDPPANAQAYRFDSVAIKEPRFEIDGVFLPPEGETGTVYFCEVQFQKDQRLYDGCLLNPLCISIAIATDLATGKR